MPQYAIYLRKSRADLEAEARGEGETLARHRRALTELAVKRGYCISEIFVELVSADTIAERPQMQILLDRVQHGDFRGVIVNDVDRLARGDSIDQGIIKLAFYSTNTLVITPGKTYDPEIEADEDSFEFSLFFSRYEYRKITRRMYMGRLRSSQEGNYTAPFAAYGFVKAKTAQGTRLAICSETGPIALMMQDMLIDQHLALPQIARQINSMGYRTRSGNPFTPQAIRSILSNPALVGDTLTRRTCAKMVIVDGRREKQRVKNDEPTIVRDTHPALCSRERFAAGLAILNQGEPHTKKEMTMKNPLAGLVRCAECGRTLILRGGMNRTLSCQKSGCPTTGIDYKIVEDAILEMLEDWQYTYSAPGAARSADRDAERQTLAKQASTLRQQLARQYELLEQGIYTPAEFTVRRADINEKIAAVEAKMTENEDADAEPKQIIKSLPQIRHVLDAYPLAQSIEDKNNLLKSVLSEVEYHKTHKHTNGENPAEYLTLILHPVMMPKMI